MTVRVITLGLLIGLSLAASADTLTGKVVKITDDDTLYVPRRQLLATQNPEFVTNVTASSVQRGQNSNRNTARVITGQLTPEVPPWRDSVCSKPVFLLSLLRPYCYSQVSCIKFIGDSRSVLF